MVIKLPENIDYTKYYSTQGMSTKLFGPGTWIFLFSSIMGRYPVKIDVDNPEHIEIQNAFKSLLTSLDITLPCVFCRNSYKGFIKELPIDEFLIGRIELMYWLYLIKDKVNQKLIKQEKECFKQDKQKIQELYHNKKITKAKRDRLIKKLKENSFKTVPTPSFKTILNFYEKRRGKCNKQKKTC
jgi:hypothetical protein